MFVLTRATFFSGARVLFCPHSLSQPSHLGGYQEEGVKHGYCSAGLHRLRGVFLAARGAEEIQIEDSFCAAIRIAKEQKSVSLEKRAETTYAEYRRQKASGSGGRGFRLPIW